MNNYLNFPGNNDYLANILPNNISQKANNNYQQGNVYDPYQGFIRGTMFPELYDPYKMNKPFEIQPMNEQAQMLTNIDALTFATIDLNLYLDVNPNDKNAIELFNQYRTQKNELVKAYENQFGPLTLGSNALTTFPWVWDNRPWPWEN